VTLQRPAVCVVPKPVDQLECRLDVAALQPRQHVPPQGWTRETFDQVTSALAAALVGAIERIDRERAAHAKEEHSTARLGGIPPSCD
jgi:hypothetical protein